MKVTVLVPARDEDTAGEAVAHAERYTEVIRGMSLDMHLHQVGEPIVMWGNSIDHIRAELACAFMATDADVAACFDDDVSLVDTTDLHRMLSVLEESEPLEGDRIDVLAAPYLNRHGGGFYTMAVKAPERIAGMLVLECATVTLGCTLIRRHVFQTMQDHFSPLGAEKVSRPWAFPDDLTYDSVRTPGKKACALYQPGVMSGKQLGDITSEARHYCGEDKMFSVRAHEAGLRLHAAPMVFTNHRGLVGRLAEDPLVSQMMNMRTL